MELLIRNSEFVVHSIKIGILPDDFLLDPVPLIGVTDRTDERRAVYLPLYEVVLRPFMERKHADLIVVKPGEDDDRRYGNRSRTALRVSIPWLSGSPRSRRTKSVSPRARNFPASARVRTHSRLNEEPGWSARKVTKDLDISGVIFDSKDFHSSYFPGEGAGSR